MRRIDLEDPGTPAWVARALNAADVVVLPTDTLYGLSAVIDSRKAFDRLLALKGYDARRPFVHLAESIDMVARYIGGWGCTSDAELRGIWPAPLTAVLPSGERAPAWVGKTIAFRVPEAPELIRLIRAVGQPIVSTSVNRAGEPPLDDADAIAAAFGDEIDLLVVGASAARGAPSTVVDFTGKTPRVIRRGAYPW
jgi:L-threonylcarbamoyladenylate synthase